MKIRPPRRGCGSVEFGYSGALTVVALGTFFVLDRQAANPSCQPDLPLALFRSRNFVVATSSA